MVNKELFADDEEKYRDESAYRKSAKYARDFYEAGVFTSEDDYFKELQIQKRELEKERKKLQTEKLDYNRWIREDARDEMITEEICNSIRTLTPLCIPDYIEPVHSNESRLLAYGDAHYGIEFQLKDLFGNIINEYSPEIFEERMWDMMNQVVEIVLDKHINELTIFDLGDGIDGIIRLSSQLMKLRYGIIDSSIKYANFISEWLNELSQYVRIKFQMVEDSNHSQLRICGAKKNAFSEENMSKVIMSIIKERLKDNPNIVIIENPTGMNYAQMSTFATLGYHGESKNALKAINDFSRTYNVPISYLIGAHIHHMKSEEAGIQCETLGIRSIIGVDPYGLSLNKTSNAGASLFTFDQLKGLTCENRLILN